MDEFDKLIEQFVAYKKELQAIAEEYDSASERLEKLLKEKC